MKTFWLSFCDNERPKGQQFLGACVVDVDNVDIAAAAFEVAEKFPHAKEGAEEIAAASRKAWSLGCNPGGQMLSLELPEGHPNAIHYPRGVLMLKADIEAIEEKIDAAETA